MANADQVYGTNGPSVDTGAHQRLYSISITQSGFNSTAGNTGSGGVTPATYNDFGTKPSSTNNSLRMARGNIRFRRMLEQLSTYTNFKIMKLQGDSSEDQNTQIASLSFNIAFENDSFIPSSATSIDGSTAVATREHVIRDLIARALLSTFTEKALVYNNTNTHQEINDVTCTAVNNDGDTISAITVARVDNYDVAGDSEVPA